MDNFTEGDRFTEPTPPPPSTGPTPLMVGLILGIIALFVLCCLGWAVLAAFMPPPN